MSRQEGWQWDVSIDEYGVVRLKNQRGESKWQFLTRAAATILAKQDRTFRPNLSIWGARKPRPKGENTMTNIQPTTAIIPFHGSALRVKDEGGVKWIAVRPICEHLGVDWASQNQKLRSDARFNCRDIPMVAEDGKQRSMTALNQNELLGWLYTINPNKVKTQARPLLLAYQKETTQAISDYWTKGQAVRPAVTQDADPMLAQLQVMTEMRQAQLEQEQRLRELELRVDAAPIATDPSKSKRIKDLVQVWARCMRKGKASFGLAYREFYERFDVPNYQALPSNRFDEACEFLTLQIKAYGGQLPDRLL